METYIFLVIIIVLAGCLGSLSKKLYNIATIIPCFLLGIIYAFRSLDCGNDTLTYSYIFDQISGYNIEEILASHYEVFYSLFNWGIFQLGGSYYDLMIIEAIVLMGAILYFLLKKSYYPWVALLLFMGFGCFHQAMNVSRQFIAIAIILYAMHFIEQKKPLKFAFFVLCAAMFHSSAVIAFLMYPLNYLNVRGKEWLLIAIAGAVFLLKERIINIFLLFLSSGYQIIEPGTEGLKLLIVWTILMVVLSFISIQYNFKDAQRALKLVFVAILFQSFVGELPVIGRLSYYFIVPFYLIVPNVIRGFQSLNTRIFLITALVCMILIFYIGFYLPGGASNTVPYVSQF